MLRNSKWGAVECNCCGRRYCRVMLRKKLLGTSRLPGRPSASDRVSRCALGLPGHATHPPPTTHPRTNTVCSQMRAAFQSTGLLCHCQLVDTGACPCQACFKRERRRAQKRKREAGAQAARARSSGAPRGRGSSSRAKTKRARRPAARAAPRSTGAAPARPAKRATKGAGQTAADSHGVDAGFEHAKRSTRRQRGAASRAISSATRSAALDVTAFSREAHEACALGVDYMAAAAAVAVASPPPDDVPVVPTRVQRLLTGAGEEAAAVHTTGGGATPRGRAAVKAMPAARQPSRLYAFGTTRRGIPGAGGSQGGATVAQAVSSSATRVAAFAHHKEWRTVAPGSRTHARAPFDVSVLPLDVCDTPGDEDDREGQLADLMFAELMTEDLVTQTTEVAPAVAHPRGSCAMSQACQPQASAMTHRSGVCLGSLTQPGRPAAGSVGGKGATPDLVVACPSSGLAVDVYGTHAGAKSPPLSREAAPATPPSVPADVSEAHAAASVGTHERALHASAPAVQHAQAWTGHFVMRSVAHGPAYTKPAPPTAPRSRSDSGAAPIGGSPRSPRPEEPTTTTVACAAAAGDVRSAGDDGAATALARLAHVARSRSGDSFGPMHGFVGRSQSNDSLGPLCSWW